MGEPTGSTHFCAQIPTFLRKLPPSFLLRLNSYFCPTWNFLTLSYSIPNPHRALEYTTSPSVIFAWIRVKFIFPSPS